MAQLQPPHHDMHGLPSGTGPGATPEFRSGAKVAMALRVQLPSIFIATFPVRKGSSSAVSMPAWKVLTSDTPPRTTDE